MSSDGEQIPALCCHAADLPHSRNAQRRRVQVRRRPDRSDITPSKVSIPCYLHATPAIRVQIMHDISGLPEHASRALSDSIYRRIRTGRAREGSRCAECWCAPRTRGVAHPANAFVRTGASGFAQGTYVVCIICLLIYISLNEPA